MGAWLQEAAEPRVRKLTQGEIARKLIASPLIGEELKKPTARDIRLLTLYGITEADERKILEYQGGGCGVCQRPPVNYRLGTDHDHATGAVRGKLCRSCNKGIAYFRDQAHLLRLAAAYIELPPAKIALGREPAGRVGRSTRKWRTKRERRERMAGVAARLEYLGYSVPKGVAKWIK